MVKLWPGVLSRLTSTWVPFSTLLRTGKFWSRLAPSSLSAGGSKGGSVPAGGVVGGHLIVLTQVDSQALIVEDAIEADGVSGPAGDLDSVSPVEGNPVSGWFGVSTHGIVMGATEDHYTPAAIPGSFSGLGSCGVSRQRRGPILLGPDVISSDPVSAGVVLRDGNSGKAVARDQVALT